jgi:MoaA/NifB/PqqE/SkfB family radical SAM enzyme
MEAHAANVSRIYDLLRNNEVVSTSALDVREYPSFVYPDTTGDVSPQGPQEIVSLAAPWRVTLDTNKDDCNFSCTMCECHSVYSTEKSDRLSAGVKSRRMDPQIIDNITRELAPLGLKEVIPTTMGEPLMFKHFPAFIKACAEHNLKLNLTTNGSFYGKGVTAWSDVLLPHLSDVKISWNGITESTQMEIMRGSSLKKQLENLKQFLLLRDEFALQGGNRPTVTLQMTFMEKNLEELPRIVAMAIDLGVDRCKGHHLWAHFNEIKGENLRRDRDSIQRWNRVAAECRALANERPLPNRSYLRLDNFFDLDPISADSDHSIHPEAVCPFLGKEAWVNYSGRFDPCCAPDKERANLGYFGNVNDEGGLLKIWNSKKYQSLVKNYSKNEVCKTCTMRRPPSPK